MEPTGTAPPDPDQLSIFGEPPAAPARGRTRRSTKSDAPIRPARTRLAMPAALQPYRSLLRLGTSSWSFAGWQGLVYDDPGAPYAESRLSREGLPAYASHPLLTAAGIDRGFYAAVPVADHVHYASQVPPGFRFLVKAPGSVTDALRRDDSGRGVEPNAAWLDAPLAIGQFVEPAVAGLGDALGTLLFQFSPMPASVLADVPGWVETLRRFLRAMPRALPEGAGYAVELRDPALLTPRLMDMLREEGVGYCLGLHDRMPPIGRQLRALDRLEDGAPGPLVARWSLHAGIGYEQARKRYAPFRDLVDPDPAIREPLAERAAAALLAGRPVTVIANNKAEGSAPLTLAALADAIAAKLPAAASRAAEPPGGTGRDD
ncbi:MAG TPA: DUF72 domain-containing protein [Burkholderiaceae bacterium]|nr:DUF72 domain-containing protein [Burkholderiaceae bacterium]